MQTWCGELDVPTLWISLKFHPLDGYTHSDSIPVVNLKERKRELEGSFIIQS